MSKKFNLNFADGQTDKLYYTPFFFLLWAEPAGELPQLTTVSRRFTGRSFIIIQMLLAQTPTSTSLLFLAMLAGTQHLLTPA